MTSTNTSSKTSSKTNRSKTNTNSSNTNTNANANNTNTVRTAVIVHGFHLGAQDWLKVVYGDVPNQKLGRIARAALVAIEQKADCIVFGSGASSDLDRDGEQAQGRDLDRDWDRDQDQDQRAKPAGKVESVYIMELMKRKLSDLRTDFPRAFQNITSTQLAALSSIMIPETFSKNTKEELKLIGEILYLREISRVFLVSSPTHMPRCIRDATSIFDKWHTFSSNIYAAPSEVCYHDSVPGDVQIFEPPHRPNRSRAWNKVLSKIWEVPEEFHNVLGHELNWLLQKYTNLDSAPSHDAQKVFGYCH